MMMPSAYFPPMEHVVSEAPLVVRRAVRWGDCDPADIVYTPRYLDYVVSAYQAFFGLMLGRSMHSAEHASLVGFPVRGVELDFRQRMPVDACFDMEVRVGAIRARTFDLHITAWKLGRDDLREPFPSFVARITPISIEKTGFEATTLPDALRAKVAAYAAGHPYIPEGKL